MDDDPQQACEVSAKQYALGSIRKQTVTERLESRRAHLAQELEMVNQALTALKANPGVKEVMNLISQVGY
jgi:hypothetical protein